MKVTLQLPNEDQWLYILSSFEKTKMELQEQMNFVDKNIEAIRKAITHVKEFRVRSDWDSAKFYDVTYDSGVWTCTCASFKHGGTDTYGHCKHIRSVSENN